MRKKRMSDLNKKEYKDTLNLPQTAFPMKASLAQREPVTLKFWEEKKVYKTLRKMRAGRNKFILNDGPPYANGHLHCGHALNKTLKDIIIKARSFAGFDAPFVPGWDCHGLPIELNVEKKWGKAGVKISKEDFRQKCREYASEQIDIQRNEFKRLGVFGDWEHPYSTMDFTYEANIIRSLSKIIQNGYLARGFKPVHWCMDCQSALAEAEVEYEDKTSMAIDVAFAFENKPNTSVVIWTTTPWTLPANEAVALNPKMEYAFVEVNQEDKIQCYLIANDLVEKTMERYGIEKYKIINTILGKELEGQKVKHPFYHDKLVPIVLGDHVTTEAGTGAVHTAPAHGPDDYLIGKKYDLPIESPVMGSGVYAPTVKIFAGEHVLKADQHVVDLLKENGALVHLNTLTHSYPNCWRHKKPVIFRATAQWFLSFDKPELRENMDKAIDSVQWIPDWGNNRMRKMMENRPDWCISRQRSWGTPITLFIHKETGDIHPDMPNLIEKIAQKVEQKGIEAWFELDSKELLGDDAESYEKVQDTLDVWFDSGVAHECVLKQRPDLAYPADVYLEGSDQYRGWFNSSLVTGVMLNNEAPFKTILSHGFTIDSQGRKMSKSIGNVIEPDQVIRDLGADVLRLWVASSDYRNELAISDEIFKRVADAYRRIRNTARFLLSNLFDFDPSQHLVKTEKLLALDQWAVLKTAQLQDEIIEAYKSFQFHVIYQKLHNFCAVELGGFYLDIIKDRQYTTQKDSLARRSCQTAMFHIVMAMTRWLAPILSFTAEEIWQHLPENSHMDNPEGKDSVFFNEWYQHPEFKAVFSLESNMNQYHWDWIIALREAVNKELEIQRTAGKIGSSLAADLILTVNETTREKLNAFGKELRFIFMTSGVTIKDANAGSQEYSIEVQASPNEKCIRCWHRCEDIGNFAEDPELCGRCVENVEGVGEVREFA